MKKTIGVLTVLIIVLSLTATITGIFYKTGGESFDFTTLRGETISVYGSGLYRYDSRSAVSQAVAQDIVTLAVGIPLLVMALFLFHKNRLRGKLLLTGTLGYFLYTYISYSVMAAYNSLFLVYTALYSLSLFAFILSIRIIDVNVLLKKITIKFPRKTISFFLFLLGFMLLLLWLRRIVPSLINNTVPVGLESYSTLVIQAMDLGLIVPVAILSAILLLKKKSWGYLLASVILVKGLAMLIAVSAMVVGMVLSDVPITIMELILFPAFAFIGIIMTVLLFRNISD